MNVRGTEKEGTKLLSLLLTFHEVNAAFHDGGG